MGSRKKKIIMWICVAAVLAALAAAGIMLMNRQNQEDRALYDEYAIEAQKDFAKMNESIGLLTSGQQVGQDQLKEEYELTLNTLVSWNQVFPTFARKNQLPFVDSMNNGLLEQEDALAVIMEKLNVLYEDVNAAYYEQEKAGTDAVEKITVLADEVRCNLIVVCKRLSRAE